MMLRLDADTRAKLLRHIAALRIDADPAGTGDRVRAFLPLPRYALALRPDAVVLEGSRGAGKTALFGLLTHMPAHQIPAFFQDPSIPTASWVAAYADGRDHPLPAVLDQLVEQVDPVSDEPLRAFWAVHLLTRLVDQRVLAATLPAIIREHVLSAPNEPGSWLARVQPHLAAVIGALDAIDRALEGEHTYVFASYDHLDRLGTLATTRTPRQRLVRSLLALWLSLSSRYRYLRAKIFLRPDLLDEAERAFPDASKLRARSVSLDWDVSSLYMLAVRHLGNAGPEIVLMNEWLTSRAKLALTQHPASADFGVLPPPMGENEQWTLVTALAGEQVGSGPKKGYTYRWIPQRLKDAEGRIVPRSILRLLKESAISAQQHPRGKGPLVTPEDLMRGLIETSHDRVTELGDEYNVVMRLENLTGKTMLMDRPDVIALLARPTSPNDKFGTDGEAIFDELRRIGVLEWRSDGRVDVPDIYRYGYNIKRKGGARMPR